MMIKLVKCEMVVQAEVSVAAENDHEAIAAATAILRAKWRGTGYTLRNFQVEDAPK